MKFSIKSVVTCSTVMAAFVMAAYSAAIMTGTPAQAQSCKEMQVYLSISPLHRENVMSYIAPKLKKKHGTTLVTEAIGSAVMVERLSVQGDKPRVTIAHWDVPIGMKACKQGMCTPIDVSKAPNVGNLYDWGVVKDAAGKHIVIATNTVGVGLIYRTDIFKEKGLAPPTSWSDLKRNDLKGRVSITHPTSTWGTAALVMHARLNGGSEKNIDPGFKTTMEILPYVNKVHLWSSEMSNLVQLGEVWLATTGSNLGPSLRKKGLAVKWIVPKEGSPSVGGGLSLVKGAPCQDVAHDYLQLYYNDEFQLMRMQDGGVTSPTKTVWKSAPAALIKDLPISPESFDNLLQLDWNTINKDRPGWIKRWQREVR